MLRVIARDSYADSACQQRAQTRADITRCLRYSAIRAAVIAARRCRVIVNTLGEINGNGIVSMPLLAWP